MIETCLCRHTGIFAPAATVSECAEGGTHLPRSVAIQCLSRRGHNAVRRRRSNRVDPIAPTARRGPVGRVRALAIAFLDGSRTPASAFPLKALAAPSPAGEPSARARTRQVAHRLALATFR